MSVLGLNSGKHVLVLSFSGFDPIRDIGLMTSGPTTDIIFSNHEVVRLNPRKKSGLAQRHRVWWVAPPHQCVITMKSVSFPVS